MEEFYTYIIYSEKKDIFYKGFSTNPYKRLEQHNLNEGRFTKDKGPWILVYLEKFPTKRQALIRERKLKKYSKKQIKQLMNSSKNILK